MEEQVNIPALHIVWLLVHISASIALYDYTFRKKEMKPSG